MGKKYTEHISYSKNIKAKYKSCDFNLYHFKLHGKWKKKECTFNHIESKRNEVRKRKKE